MAKLNGWLTISRLNGKGNSVVTLTASANETDADRSTSLKIKTSTKEVILNLSQYYDLIPGLYYMQKKLVSSEWGGDSKTVYVYHTHRELTYTAPEWVNITSVNEERYLKYKIEFTPNTTGVKRVGEFILGTPDGTTYEPIVLIQGCEAEENKVIYYMCANDNTGAPLAPTNFYGMTSYQNLYKRSDGGAYICCLYYENEVTSAHTSLFEDKDGLYAISFPPSVETIGEYAFRSCSNLVSVDFSENISNIKRYAFDNVEHIAGATDADDVELSILELPSNLFHIWDSAFQSCTGTKIIIFPKALSIIDRWAFAGGYRHLEKIVCKATTPPKIWEHSAAFFQVKPNGILYYPYGSDYSEWLNEKDDSAFLGYYNWTGETFIPEDYEFPEEEEPDNPVIPDNPDEPDEPEIPDTPDTPDEPDTPEEPEIPDTPDEPEVSLIPDNELWVKRNNGQFEAYFNDTSGFDQRLINTRMDEYGWTIFEFDAPLTKIGADAFFGHACGVTDVIMPDTVTEIGSQAFTYQYTLKSVIFPKSLTKIGNYAFLMGTTGNNTLTEIELGENLTSIGYGVFEGLNALTKIACKATTAPEISQSGTFVVPNGGTLYYPEGSDYSEWLKNSEGFLGYYGWTGKVISDDYVSPEIPQLPDAPLDESNEIWVKSTDGTMVEPDSNAAFGSKISSTRLTDDGWTVFTFDKGVPKIYDSTFEGFDNIEAVILPDGITSIGDRAFYNCKSLTTINIPDSVTSIGRSAFYYCSKLTSITIPDGVTSIGEYTFNKCTSLASINIPEGVTSIGGNAFEGCSNLTNVTIPDGVTSIGDRAFQSCSSLTSITIPNSVTSIDEYAFYACSSIAEFNGKFATEDKLALIDNNNILMNFAPASNATTYNIPNGVTNIGKGAFSFCKLTSITIPDSVTSIGDSAFSSCGNLRTITCEGTTAPTIRYTTFQNVKRSGSLYYPSGSDYSKWLSTNSYYLGYYNWTGVTY